MTHGCAKLQNSIYRKHFSFTINIIQDGLEVKLLVASMRDQNSRSDPRLTELGTFWFEMAVFEFAAL
jgi:hypothetical protein